MKLLFAYIFVFLKFLLNIYAEYGIMLLIIEIGVIKEWVIQRYKYLSPWLFIWQS